MRKDRAKPVSDSVRQHAQEAYIRPARRRGDKFVSINVGQVHRAVALHNRVPLVCQALESEKFLRSNRLRLTSKTGPPSGQSTTVTYTYELIANEAPVAHESDHWLALRGALKDIFSEAGGGERYLGRERDAFYDPEAPPSGEQK
ncbi:MAG TPA: hypothetical protein VE994_14530 [Terriglobales bacterium]|nr:hypothetical protein [Terriglobales bacterium]